MGEKPNNRRAFENVVGRIVLNDQMRGREPNVASARAQAADVARVRDQQRDDGSARNRAARKPVEVERRVVKPGRVFVDLGRKR